MLWPLGAAKYPAGRTRLSIGKGHLVVESAVDESGG